MSPRPNSSVVSPFGVRLSALRAPRSALRTPYSAFVERLAIDPGDVRDVFRRLEPAFDFQRGHPCPNQVRQHLESGQILWTEQVTPLAQRDRFAVGDQFIGHAT